MTTTLKDVKESSVLRSSTYLYGMQNEHQIFAKLSLLDEANAHTKCIWGVLLVPKVETSMLSGSWDVQGELPTPTER